MRGQQVVHKLVPASRAPIAQTNLRIRMHKQQDGLARRGINNCAGQPEWHGQPYGGGVTVLVHWIGTGHLAATRNQLLRAQPTSPPLLSGRRLAGALK